jgi:hypothetical protein
VSNTSAAQPTYTTSNTRALAARSSVSTADPPRKRQRSARLSRTGPKPPAAISIHAIPSTEVCCTEFKRYNKETRSFSGEQGCLLCLWWVCAGKRVGRRLQQHTRGSQGDSRAQGIAQRSTWRGAEGPPQKRWSEVNNESGTTNGSFGFQSKNKGGREASPCRTYKADDSIHHAGQSNFGLLPSSAACTSGAWP